MEKSLYLTVLVVFAVLGSNVSASNNKFLLRELIRELGEAQVDTPAPVPPKTTPSDVEDDLPNPDDLTGLGGNDEEEQTHPVDEVEEGTEGQEGEGGAEGQEGEGGAEGQEGQEGTEGHKGQKGAEGQGGEEGAEGHKGKEGAKVHKGQEGEEGHEGKEGEEGQEGGEGAKVHEGETTDVHEGETADLHEGEEGETTEQAGDLAPGEGEGQDESNNGGEGGKGADDKNHDENPKMDEGVNEDETPVEPVKGEGPSALEKSAVKTVRLIDNLSRMLAMRATSLAKIDKVLTEGPEVNYPNTEKLVQKQQQLEIMSARILEMKKVLGHFFDQIYDRFHSFMTDVEEKEDHIPPVSKPKESVPLIKPDSTTEKQTELLKRLLSALKRHKQ